MGDRHLLWPGIKHIFYFNISNFLLENEQTYMSVIFQKNLLFQESFFLRYFHEHWDSIYYHFNIVLYIIVIFRCYRYYIYTDNGQVRSINSHDDCGYKTILFRSDRLNQCYGYFPPLIRYRSF